MVKVRELWLCRDFVAGVLAYPSSLRHDATVWSVGVLDIKEAVLYTSILINDLYSRGNSKTFSIFIPINRDGL